MNKRRNLLRLSTELYLRMFVMDRKAQGKIVSFKARALDFSYGEFWVESPRELTKGEIVGFELDKSEAGSMEKVGEVISCTTEKESPYFTLRLAVYP